MDKLVMVLNLNTGKKMFYTCTPLQAVVAAHAQDELDDWNTYDYDKKYQSLVEIGRDVLLCGNCSAFMDGRVF